jgi:hypothetical protein
MNTRPLSGIQLRQLVVTSWNTSSRDLRPSVLSFSFHKSITAILLHWTSFIQVCLGFKFCPVLEIVGLRVPTRYIRDFALFNVCSSCKNCPFVGCVSAANVVCRDADVLGAKNVLLNHILYYYYYPFSPHNGITIANTLL